MTGRNAAMQGASDEKVILQAPISAIHTYRCRLSG